MKSDNLRLNNWVISLLRKLFLGYGKYFSKSGVLNSDGRRVLNEVIKPILEQNPQIKPLIKDVRKEPTLENLRKLAELYISRELIEDLINDGIYLSVLYREKLFK